MGLRNNERKVVHQNLKGKIRKDVERESDIFNIDKHIIFLVTADCKKSKIITKHYNVSDIKLSRFQISRSYMFGYEKLHWQSAAMNGMARQ